MFKSLVAKFLAKSLLTKILITGSTVVIIGGSVAGTIIIPKKVEEHKEEVRQEEIKLEKEEDLKNISITLKEDISSIQLPLNGDCPPRFDNTYKGILFNENNEIIYNAFEQYIENYSGGKLSITGNIDLSNVGQYTVTYNVTSEKGNIKSIEQNIEVWDFTSGALSPIADGRTNITVYKGNAVDIMEGITFGEDFEIKVNGTVDTNTVGIYTVEYVAESKKPYTYGSMLGVRTYNVKEKETKLSGTYQGTLNGSLYTLKFDGNSWSLSVGGSPFQKGKYTLNENKINLTEVYEIEEYETENYNFDTRWVKQSNENMIINSDNSITYGLLNFKRK